MQLHQLRPTHKKKKKKRIGRGGKRGTYCGHGDKGQKSRAGAKFQPPIRESIKRYPKKRGYRFNPIKSKPAVLNVEILEKKFKENAKINPRTLIDKHLIRKIKGGIPLVKILGRGKITKPLIIDGCEVSEAAKKKIEKAGGHIKDAD